MNIRMMTIVIIRHAMDAAKKTYDPMSEATFLTVILMSGLFDERSEGSARNTMIEWKFPSPTCPKIGPVHVCDMGLPSLRHNSQITKQRKKREERMKIKIQNNLLFQLMSEFSSSHAISSNDHTMDVTVTNMS